MTEQQAIEMVKRIIPECTDQEAGYILWNETGWPSFHHGDPEQYFANQIRQYKESLSA